ncbi:hypothetical protein [Croceicoccus sp. YJ47]|nr:hypothetical protein [Croceicoccus sp. YJ47]
MAEVSLDAVISALIENSRQAGARSIARPCRFRPESSAVTDRAG